DDTAAKDFGATASPIGTSVDDLSINTAAGGGNQFVTEASGLTALNLNAGTGNVTLVGTVGAIAEVDAPAHIAASSPSITLADAAAKDLGSLVFPIGTSVNDLSVSTLG